MKPTIKSGCLALIASCALALAAAPIAQAQFSLVDPSAQSVMSSKDFNALLDALKFDAAQRATAGPLFDDAQVELISARDELASHKAPAHNADSKALADYETHTRAAYQRMKAAERVFFDGLAAFARPDQAALVERERLAAARRLVRRTLGGMQGSQGPVRVDLVTSVMDSKLSPEDQSRALAALVGYQTQLTALLEQALDQGLEVPSKTAKLRESGAAQSSAPVEVDEGAQVHIMEDNPARRQASQAFDALLDKIGAQHQQAMLALDGALTPREADSINAAAARRIWPRAAMDPRSPRATFAQMRTEIAKGKRPSEQLAALDSAQPAWLSAWWSSTRKAAEAENTMRRFGIFGGGGEDSKAAREKMKAAREEREQANRTAWRALAALDTENADFYSQYANPPENNREGMMFAGPHEPTPPSKLAGGEGGREGGGNATFSGAVMIVSRTSDDDGEGGVTEDTLEMPMVFEAGGPDMPVSISMGPDGVATLISDSVGDGMNGPSMMFFAEGPDSFSSQLSGARFPSPMTRERTAEFARALGGDALPAATVDQLYTQYSERVKALDDSAGAAARELLSGPPAGMSVRVRSDGQEEQTSKPRSIDDLRAGVGKMDAFATQLGAIDDELIANMAAAVPATSAAPAAAAAQTAALKEERARERVRQIQYPTLPMSMGPGQRSRTDWDLASIVRQAALNGADRQAANAAVVAWSPGALAAMEQARGTLRNVSLELLALERKMFERMERVQEGENGTRERRVTQEAVPGNFEEHEALSRKVSKANRAGNDLAREARTNLDAQLSAEGKAALLAAWCRAVAPNAFDDKRNTESRLVQALAFTDLSQEQRSQIDALRARHTSEHARLTERLGQIAADMAFPPESQGPGFQPPPASPELERLRFDRSELNERTLRRLRAILNAEQGERLAPLGAQPPKAQVKIAE